MWTGDFFCGPLRTRWRYPSVTAEQEGKGVGIEHEHLSSLWPRNRRAYEPVSSRHRSPGPPVGLCNDALQVRVVFVLARGSRMAVFASPKSSPQCEPLLDGGLEKAPFASDARPR